MFQWFWLSDALKGISFYLFDQIVDSSEDFLVVFFASKDNPPTHDRKKRVSLDELPFDAFIVSELDDGFD